MDDEWAPPAAADPYRLRARGIADRRVLEAMAAVPRAAFVPEPHRGEALADHPLPIGFGQTISQPFIVAWMSQELDVWPGHRVLEVGTGCGYQTAVLAALGAEVWSLEIVPELHEQAAAMLETLGIDRVHLRLGSGHEGWPEAAPFDRIILTAAPPDVPPPLIRQLADPGRLLAPVGTVDQVLVRIDKRDGQVTRRELMGVRFVEMKDED